MTTKLDGISALTVISTFLLACSTDVYDPHDVSGADEHTGVRNAKQELPPPLAVDDVIEFPAGSEPRELDVPAETGVLRNDDVMGARIAGFGATGETEQPHLATFATTAAGGLVALGGDGGFHYLKPLIAPTTGLDSFTYSLTNGTGWARATVTIVVGCGTATCDGCCAADGSCAAGIVDAACGYGGASCSTCSGYESCEQAVCVNTALASNGLVDDSAIRITDSIDAEKTRADLVRHIWGARGYPRWLLPHSVELDVTTTQYAASVAAWRVDRIVIDAQCTNFRSNAYVYWPAPRVRNGKLALWHQGHSYFMGSGGGAETIDQLLRMGYTVVGLWMTGFGETSPAIFHDEMVQEPLTRNRVIGCLLEPSIATLNWAELAGFSDFVMIGLSGGGWTTTMMAALDARLRLSVPVAGTLPLYLRTFDFGDFEQTDPHLYRIAGYPDLYVLGAGGRGRAQLQVLNAYDSCCFSGDRYTNYLSTVQMAVAAIGTYGKWELFVDYTHHEHKISDWALETAILPFLRSH